MVVGSEEDEDRYAEAGCVSQSRNTLEHNETLE